MSKPSFGQSKTVDSLIQKFLVQNKELDTIINSHIKTKDKVIIERNYFINKVFDVNNNGCQLIGYSFGSNSSFRSSHMIMDISNKAGRNYLFFGKEGFEKDMKKIIDLFCSNDRDFLPNDRRKIIQSLMKLYLDNLLDTMCNKGKNVL